MPAISVIIPAYNSSAYINSTIESILNQSFTDYEILVIDDGSTDSTVDIVNGCAKRDGRVSLHRIDHSGPAAARNTGLRKAVGEYLYFIDADDELLPEMLERMYLEAKKHNAQIVACGYTLETWSRGRMKLKAFRHPYIATQKAEDFRSALLDLMKAHLMYVVWNKLINREFILEHNISFGDYLIGEDRLFICDTFEYLERFVVVDEPLHRYINRNNEGLVNKYVDNRLESLTRCYNKLCALYGAWGMLTPENQGALDYIHIKAVVSCFTQLHSKLCPLNSKEKVVYVKDILSDDNVRAAAKLHDKEIPYSSVVSFVVRTQNAQLNLGMAWLIYFMNARINSLFLKIKHFRIKKENAA